RRAVQTKSAGNGSGEFSGIPTGHGEPLDGGVRKPLESHFQADLSGVRIHTGAEAAESARSVDALAYTAGRDVYFAAGMYAPASSTGRRLIAHEVAHVVQQSSGKEPTIAAKSAHGVKIGAPDDTLEIEADRAAEAFSIGAPNGEQMEDEHKGREPPPVQRFIQRQTSSATGAQRDFLDRLGDAASGVLNTASQAVGDAAGAVVSTVSDVATAPSNTVDSVVGTVSSAVTNTGKSVAAAASSVAAIPGAALDRVKAATSQAILQKRLSEVRQHLAAAGGDVKPSEPRRLQLNAQIGNLNAAIPAPLPLLNPGVGVGGTLTGIGEVIAGITLIELAAVAAVVLIILLILAAILLIIAENVDDFENDKAKEEKRKAKERDDEEERKRKKKEEKKGNADKKKFGLPCPDPASGLLETENNIFSVIAINAMAKAFASFRKDFHEARNGPGTYCSDGVQIKKDRESFAFRVNKAAQVCTLTVCSPDPVGPHGAIIAHAVGTKDPGEFVHAEISALPQIEVQLAIQDPKGRIGATLFSICLDLACSGKGPDGCDVKLGEFVAKNLPGGSFQSKRSRNHDQILDACHLAFESAVTDLCS
ncbi:MAG: DUF4157 domain-containing protein, partial [Alloacidobacterium sp.]